MAPLQAYAAQLAGLFPCLAVCVFCLGIFSISRGALLLWMHERLLSAGIEHLPFVLGQGLRFDIVTLGLLLGPLFILFPIASMSSLGARAWSRIAIVWCLSVIGLVLFMEIATPPFVNEFDAKPDRRFFEYLVEPREVAATLWGAYAPWIAIGGVSIPGVLWRCHRWLVGHFRVPRTVSPSAAALYAPIIALLTVAAVRSTTDHRPVNPSTVVFSSDPLANQFSLNSTYSLLYAAYEFVREDDEFAYRTVSPRSAAAAARAEVRIDPTRFSGGPSSTEHAQPATQPRRHPLNLVIVLEESLGAEFVGALGGLPLTPNLDRLSEQGIWFERLYATGTRSVRGIEAVTTGFLPTTSRAIVKRPLAQRDFFTLAGLLARQGYATSFLYGGEPQFDNMARFLGNNGVESIIGRHDFAGDVYEGAWGVADEDLFSRANEHFATQPEDRPFFSLVFTTSNHSPWDFPPGRIELFESPKATRHNAVKYADYALGRFFDSAGASAYWNDTVFLVVADHASRVRGAELVPIEGFRIPGLILGGEITPGRVERIASQIDLLPTLLSLIGIDSAHPAIGIDHTREDLGRFPGRAIMQYGPNQAYLRGDEVVILRPDLPERQFRYRDGHLDPVPNDPSFLNHVVALANWPWHAYRERLYRSMPTE